MRIHLSSCIFIRHERIMIVPVIIVLILIGITYRNEITRKAAKGKPFWYPYRKLLGLLALTLIPIIVMNLIIPERIITDPAERMLLAEKQNDNTNYFEASEALCRMYPDSIPLLLQYIDDCETRNLSTYKSEDINRFPSSPDVRFMVIAYKTIRYDEVEGIAYPIDKLDSNQRFHPWLKALQHHLYATAGKKEVVRLLRKELRNNPTNERAHRLFLQISESFSPKLYDSLMCAPNTAQFVGYSTKNDYYFTHGHVGLYFQNILSHRFGSVGWLTLLASLLVSGVWVVFLRSMDVFNREKWGPIILVFITGALFTHLCLPLYDTAQLVYGLQLNGEAANDFLYCTLVIGGSEEIVKLLPWLLFAWFSKRMREPFDYLLYASVSALGFAFAENLMYLEDTGNIVGRTIMSSVGHMFDASIVAYAFILSRYRYTQVWAKWLLPVAGFLLAALAHGFYDFWLISEAVEEYAIVTTLFFIASLHIWFFFKNNALNNSDFFTTHHVYRAGFQQDLLTFSLLGMLMVEYTFVSVEYGADDGNQIIVYSSYMVFLFLVYVSLMLHRIDLQKGVWKRFRFALPGIGRLVGMPSGETTETNESEDFTGLKLRLFAPKTNPYIGDKLPKSGTCVKPIRVNGHSGWYVFELNTPIHYGSFVPTHIIVKNKLPHQPLNQPKIEIYFMFVPDIDLLRSENIAANQLRYAGRAYSMPI